MTDQPTTPAPDELDETTQPGEDGPYVEPATDPELPERAEPVEPEPTGPEPASDGGDVVSTAEPS